MVPRSPGLCGMSRYACSLQDDVNKKVVEAVTSEWSKVPNAFVKAAIERLPRTMQLVHSHPATLHLLHPHRL